VAHAAAKADDAPRNGDIPKSGPAASAAKAKHLRLPMRVSLIDRAFLIVAPVVSAFSQRPKQRSTPDFYSAAFNDLTLL
jgi:hypothetical protein